jgi:hypothetical protein
MLPTVRFTSCRSAGLIRNCPGFAARFVTNTKRRTPARPAARNPHTSRYPSCWARLARLRSLRVSIGEILNPRFTRIVILTESLHPWPRGCAYAFRHSRAKVATDFRLPQIVGTGDPRSLETVDSNGGIAADRLELSQFLQCDNRCSLTAVTLPGHRWR